VITAGGMLNCFCCVICVIYVVGSLGLHWLVSAVYLYSHHISSVSSTGSSLILDRRLFVFPFLSPLNTLSKSSIFKINLQSVVRTDVTHTRPTWQLLSSMATCIIARGSMYFEARATSKRPSVVWPMSRSRHMVFMLALIQNNA
jgi:hypothetical protein